MNKNFSPRRFFTFAAVAVMFALSTIGVMAEPFHGAIYTSKVDGTIVNQNLYDSREAVYLNGGPQNANGFGLPNGTYYFQVTDPSGQTLLSTDPAICRQLTVANGVVSGSTGPACRHANGDYNSSNLSTSVQLFPYNETPNNGGEYKVWLIRQATTTVIVGDQATSAVLDFDNSNTKTDNFKVKTFCELNPKDPTCTNLPPVTLSGHKFYDANANALDDDSQVVAGILIKLTLTFPGEMPIVVTATTDANGNWTYGPVPSGTQYVVEEILPINCEGDDATWVQTAPVADGQGFQGYSGMAFSSVGDLDFGDLCEHPGTGGLTLGYWSNKNGQKVMTNGGPNGVNQNAYIATAGTDLNADLLFLRNFNLKGETTARRQIMTSEFDPTNYTDFRNWILSANAYNMSYMLSAQLSATSLDVRHRFLSDAQIVDARNVCNTAGSCLGFITIGEVRRLANESLDAATGGNTTISGDPHRDSQELMKNFLDDVNNNRLPFVSATACAVCYPVPDAVIAD